MKVFMIVLFIATWAFGQAQTSVRGPRLTPVRVQAIKPLPWWNAAERERVRTGGSPFFFDVRSFPGRPDLGDPQRPQFPKPLW